MSDFNISVLPCANLTPASIIGSITVSNPTLTIPPPPSGGQSTFVLDLAALGSPVLTLPVNASWSSPNLTVNSSFQSGTITIGWGDNSTTFSIAVSTASAAATTSNLTVNTDGSFSIVLGSGATLTGGVASLITGIPAGGQVQVTTPVFFVTQTNDTFSVSAVNGGIVNIPTAGPGLSVSGSGTSAATVTVTDPDLLVNSQVPVSSSTVSQTFSVAKSVRTSGTPGQTSLTVNANGFIVTELSLDATFAGTSIQYQTTAANQYGFSFDGAGIVLNGSNNISWSGDSQPSFISGLSQSSSGDSFQVTNTAGVTSSATFTINTDEGVLDPTIMNNPDPS